MSLKKKPTPKSLHLILGPPLTGHVMLLKSLPIIWSVSSSSNGWGPGHKTQMLSCGHTLQFCEEHGCVLAHREQRGPCLHFCLGPWTAAQSCSVTLGWVSFPLIWGPDGQKLPGGQRLLFLGLRWPGKGACRLLCTSRRRSSPLPRQEWWGSQRNLSDLF